MAKNVKVLSSLKFIGFAVLATILGILFFALSLLNLDKKIVNAFTYTSVALYIVGAVLELIGLIRPRNESPIFTAVFSDAIASLVCGVLTILFLSLPVIPVFLTTLFNILSIFFEVSVFILFIFAICAEHAKYQNEKLIDFGRTVEWLFPIFLLIMVILKTIILSFLQAKNPTVALILGFVALGIAIAGYVIYFVFIFKSHVALNCDKEPVKIKKKDFIDSENNEFFN